MNLEESETLELKKSTGELKEGIISIVSILNKHGNGKLYFGIGNNGKIIGQDVTEKTLREISQKISENIEPKIYPEIKKVKIENKNCVLIEFNGGNKHYFAYSRAYMRVADEDRQISAKELEKMFIEKNKEELRWDKQICKKATFNDIDVDKLKIFLEKCNLEFDTLHNSLEKLKLLFNGKLINAAVILFGKKPQKFFSNAKLRCAVFATNDTTISIDMQDFEDDLFALIEKAEEYIFKNIHIGMKVEGLYRLDIPEIKKEAFREAIINAFCHRDYSEDDSVNIAIFKDRVEIKNPGKLYDNLTIEEIKTKQVSKRRNELIAELFHRGHLIEKWGRGIKLILNYEPRTKFETIADLFITTFERKQEVKKYPEKYPGNLNKTQIVILDLIKKNKFISRDDIALELKLSLEAIKKNIKILKNKRILSRVGPDKGGHWEIING